MKIYEDICMDLKLVPCSIIVKSLPTAVISLNNYGLGSAGTLALSEALKVIDFLVYFLIIIQF